MDKIAEIKKYLSWSEEALTKAANMNEADAIKAVTYDHIKEVIESEGE